MPTARTKATLRIAHQQNSAGAVTGALGIEPSRFHEAAEPRSARDTRPWGAALWSLDSPLADTEPLDAHLTWLCGQVSDKAEVLARLRADGYEFDCFCFVEVLNGQGGVTVSPDVLTALGRLTIELDLDIYASSDDE